MREYKGERRGIKIVASESIYSRNAESRTGKKSLKKFCTYSLGVFDDSNTRRPSNIYGAIVFLMGEEIAFLTRYQRLTNEIVRLEIHENHKILRHLQGRLSSKLNFRFCL